METLEENRTDVIARKLIHHWAMDNQAAQELAARMDENETAHIDEVLLEIENQDESLDARDSYRKDISKIFTGESDKQLIIIGPCSLDAETNYTELFDQIKLLQEKHPDAIVALRANGAKPRTSGGWRGLFYSKKQEDREKLFEIYQQAFSMNIPIITEITASKELGALAPYLSAFWLGARDMLSTDLRADSAAFHLPVAVKNDQTGKNKVIENAMSAINKNSDDNKGSGIDITIASTATHRGISSGILSAGKGNDTVGIIARGYELPEKMPKWVRKRKVAKHIGRMCTLAAKVNSVVLIDGSHDVPKMLKEEKTDGDRFPKVMREIIKLIRKGKIVHAEMIKGLVGEVSVSVGKTDVNHIITPDNMERLSENATELQEVTSLEPIAT